MTESTAPKRRPGPSPDKEKLADAYKRIQQLMAEVEKVKLLEIALSSAHDLLLDLRNYGSLGFSDGVRVERYLASTGHLIGRG